MSESSSNRSSFARPNFGISAGDHNPSSRPFIVPSVIPSTLPDPPVASNRSMYVSERQQQQSMFLPLWDPSNQDDPSANFHRHWGPPVPGGSRQITPLIAVPSVAGQLGRYVPDPAEFPEASLPELSNPSTRPRSSLAPLVLEESRARCILYQEDFEDSDEDKDVAQTTPDDEEDKIKHRLLKRLPCSHVFHEMCLSSYLRSEAHRATRSQTFFDLDDASEPTPSESPAFLEPSFVVPLEVLCPACRRPAPTSIIRIGMKSIDVIMHNPILPLLGMFRPVATIHRADGPRLTGRLVFNLSPGFPPIIIAPSESKVLLERSRELPPVRNCNVPQGPESLWQRLHKGPLPMAWGTLERLKLEGKINYHAETMQNMDGIWGCYILVTAVQDSRYQANLIEGCIFSAGHRKERYAKDGAATWVLAGIHLEKREAEQLEELEEQSLLQERRQPSEAGLERSFREQMHQLRQMNLDGRRLLRELEPGDPSRADILDHLGHLLTQLYRRAGDIKVLQEAIMLRHGVLRLTLEGSREQARILNNLGWTLSTQCHAEGETRVLHETVIHLRKACMLDPRPAHLDTLGVALVIQYQKEGDIAALHEGLLLLRKAFSHYPESPEAANNLGFSLVIQYRHEGNVADLRESITILRDALRRLPYENWERYHLLDSLGVALTEQHQHSGEVKELQEAIALLRETLRLRSHGNPFRPYTLNNLGNALVMYYKEQSNAADLLEAIDLLREALRLQPESRLMRPETLYNLGVALGEVCSREGSRAERKEAVELLQQALALATEQLRPSIQAALVELPKGPSFWNRRLRRANPVELIREGRYRLSPNRD